MTEDININTVQTICLWLLRISSCFAWTLVPAIHVYRHLYRLYRHPVPLILQLTTVECGAACLAMILSHYGYKTSVAKCREGFSVGRGGVTAKGIAEAARHYGLRVKAFSLEPVDFKYVSGKAPLNSRGVRCHFYRCGIDLRAGIPIPAPYDIPGIVA